MDIFGREEIAERGLRSYLRQIAAGLGVGLEATCCEIAGDANAYVALDRQLPKWPSRDVALFWDDRHGWAAGIESGSGEDVIVVAYLGGEVLPEPAAVVAFAKSLLAGYCVGQPDPPVFARDDVIARLASSAARLPDDSGAPREHFPADQRRRRGSPS